MATTNLGKVSVTPKGEYDPLITYERLDVISHNGSSYIVKQTSTGVTPIEGEFYALIAEKGDGGSFVKKAYKTYAAMDADKVNIPANSSVDVTNDPDESKNGAYIYDGVSFTRSQYDSKVVTDKIIADTAIAVQDAINNTAVEGGVLADTFVTVTENGVGTVPRTLRDVKSDLRNVKDFGAKGDGVADDSDAFQKYVDWSIANGSNYIFVPFGSSEKYRLTRTINIPASGFMIDGNSRARYNPQDNGGYIFADANVLDLFNYGVGQSFPSNQFRVNGVALLSTTGYTQNAFKMDANNDGPHRGMVFSDTCARGFVDVIHISTTNPTYISAANVVIESGCVFSGNTNVVNAVTRVFNMLVQGVQSEQGARFKGFIDGGVSFRDCMLEGQSDAIDISSNSPQIVLENNYMEKPMGRFFVRARGTNTHALFEERSNYISNIQSTDCFLMEGTIRVKQDFEYQKSDDRFSLYTFNDLVLGFGSKIKGSVYVATDAAQLESGFTGYCEPESLRQSRATAVKNKSLGTDVLKTPFGQTATGLTVTGTTGYLTLNKSWNVGDVVTITALVRANAAARPSLDLYNQEFSSMRGIAGATVPLNKVGDWQIMCTSRPVTVSGTALKLKFTMPVGTLDIAAIGIDVTKAADFKTFNAVSRAEVQIFNPLIADGSINSYTRQTPVTIPALATNEKFTFDGYITGAMVGDVVVVSPNIDTMDVTWSARVFEANQVRVTLWNRGAESVTLGYSNWKFKLFKD